jgi:hypothetical protein
MIFDRHIKGKYIIFVLNNRAYVESLNIEKSNLTPKVILNKESRIFKIEGRSLPEDVLDFYGPILDWFKEYINNPNPVTELSIKMEYFNTTSSKAIYEIFKMLKKLYENGYDTSVIWYYLKEDEGLLETGKDFQNLVGVPFVYKIIDE